MTPAIEIRELTKQYRSVEALCGISLEIQKGEFFGLLGPNGAGKTTLIKSIVGLARPTEGEVLVFGKEVRKEPIFARALIGYSPQEPNIDKYFTVRRTLEFQGGYYGLSREARKLRAKEMMAQFSLEEKAEEEFWRLSGGMQKRVLIARSLTSRPQILILDEPTAGVDVEQRHELWRLLKHLNQQGTTILLTTHYIDEAEELCKQVGIIHGGRIIELGPPRDLITKHLGPPRMVLQGGSLEEVFLKLTGRSLNQDEEREEVHAASHRLSHTG